MQEMRTNDYKNRTYGGDGTINRATGSGKMADKKQTNMCEIAIGCATGSASNWATIQKLLKADRTS